MALVQEQSFWHYSTCQGSNWWATEQVSPVDIFSLATSVDGKSTQTEQVASIKKFGTEH